MAGVVVILRAPSALTPARVVRLRLGQLQLANRERTRETFQLAGRYIWHRSGARWHTMRIDLYRVGVIWCLDMCWITRNTIEVLTRR